MLRTFCDREHHTILESLQSIGGSVEPMSNIGQLSNLLFVTLPVMVNEIQILSAETDGRMV